jgi:hypothetical protein
MAKDGTNRSKSAHSPLRDQIVRWLQESGNYVNMQTLPNADFAIQASYPRPQGGAAPLGYFVLKPSTDRAIAVLTNVALAPEHRAALAAKSPAQRQSFLRELQMGITFHCGYNLQMDGQTQETVSIQLSEEIYYEDSIERKDLYDALVRIYRAYAFLGLKFQELPPTAYQAP